MSPDPGPCTEGQTKGKPSQTPHCFRLRRVGFIARGEIAGRDNRSRGADHRDGDVAAPIEIEGEGAVTGPRLDGELQPALLSRMPVARPNLPVCTVEDYKLMPETGPRYQLVEGDLCMSPAPNRYHQDISRNLEYLLLRYLEDHPIGILYHAPFDVYLDDTNVYQPDIAVILNANRGILTDAGAEGAPDFIVEILSPKTRRLDLDPKKRVYARHGVKELWIIDPEPRTVEVYELSRDAERPVRTVAADGRLESALFPGLIVSAVRVFAR